MGYQDSSLKVFSADPSAAIATFADDSEVYEAPRVEVLEKVNDGEGNFEGSLYAVGSEHSPVAFGYLDIDYLIDFVSFDTCSYRGSEVFFSVHD